MDHIYIYIYIIKLDKITINILGLFYKIIYG